MDGGEGNWGRGAGPASFFLFKPPGFWGYLRVGLLVDGVNRTCLGGGETGSSPWGRGWGEMDREVGRLRMQILRNWWFAAKHMSVC